MTRVVGTLAGATLAASMLAGCKFFDIGNPLLPKARPIAFPEPSSLVVSYIYRRADDAYAVAPNDVQIRVRTLANDTSPGVIFQSYTAEYFDQTGLPITSLLLSKVNFGVAAYLPPASGLAPADINLRLPIYNQQVRMYGQDQVFTRRPVDYNRLLIHSINCRVTLYGIDDNFNEIEVPFSVPIRFDGEVQP